MLDLLRFHIRILTDDFSACFQFYRTAHFTDPTGTLFELNADL